MLITPPALHFERRLSLISGPFFSKMHAPDMKKARAGFRGFYCSTAEIPPRRRPSSPYIYDRGQSSANIYRHRHADDNAFSAARPGRYCKMTGFILLDFLIFASLRLRFDYLQIRKISEEGLSAP